MPDSDDDDVEIESDQIIDIIFAIPVQKKIEVKLFFFIAQKIFILCKL